MEMGAIYKTIKTKQRFKTKTCKNYKQDMSKNMQISLSLKQEVEADMTFKLKSLLSGRQIVACKASLKAKQTE